MPTRTLQSQRRLVRPLSKHILRLREGDSGAGHTEELGAPPSPCGSFSWSSPAEAARCSHNKSTDGGDDATVDEDGKGSSSSSRLRVHSWHYGREHTLPQRQQGPRDAPQRATTTSARRGGKLSRKSNTHGPRSASPRDGLKQTSSSSTSRQSRSKGGLLGMAAECGTYYGSSPVTAQVTPSSQSSSFLVKDVVTSAVNTSDKKRQQADVRRRTTGKTKSGAILKGKEEHSNAGDAGTASFTPPGAATTTATTDSRHHRSANTPSKSTSAFSSCNTSRGTVSVAASVTSSEHHGSPPASSPETLHHTATSTAQSTPSYSCSRSSTTATATSSPPCKTSDTPLTYAAVASVSQTSSLHGKRLPKSRVGFGNFHKRVGGSGTASVGSTARIPTTAAGSPALFTDNTPNNGYTMKGYCASSCGFPSVPLTPLTCTNSQGTAFFSANGSVCRAMERDSPVTPQLQEDAVGDVESEEEGEGDGDGEGEGERGGHGRQASNPEKCNQAPKGEQTQHQQIMPPIPPSLHRHHPTNLFLQLPHQHQMDSESDEEEAATLMMLQKKANEEAEKSSGSCAAPLLKQPSASAQPPQSDKNNGSDVPPTAIAALAQRQQSAMLQEKLSQCKTSSTIKHTGPTVASKVAAELLIMPIATATPNTPALQRQPQPAIFNAPNRVIELVNQFSSSKETTPRGPAPPTISNNVNGKGMHKVSSALSFFNATEIIPGLFLGSYGDAIDTEALAAHGISLVINCSLECAVTPAMVNNANHVRYVQCPLRDHSDEAISPFFNPVTQIIHEQLHRRQINQQRMKKTTPSSFSGDTTSARSLCLDGTNEGERCGATCACACKTSIVTPHALTEGNGELGEMNNDYGVDGALHDRMLWTWADEAENVWAVPTSPASPPLSVGGQPSLKEGKHETPCTPSCALGPWGRNSDETMSTSTLGSPSQVPCRTSAFPRISFGNAAATPPDSGEPLKNSCTKEPTAITPLSVASVNLNHCGNTDLNGESPDCGVDGPNTNTTAATTPTTTTSALRTVVDPRDCGGVLVHCRMGVSRSATFVMAYLILYGFTLANLEDTASLFVGFLERERNIIEEAGGRACFGSDANGGGAAIGRTNPQTPITSANKTNAITDATRGNEKQTFNSPFSHSGTLFCNTSLAQSSSRLSSASGSSPLGTCSNGATPANTPLGARRTVNGFALWSTQRNSSNIGQQQPPSFATNRRSTTSPVASPLYTSGTTMASPRSTTPPSLLRLSTPLMPLEVCARFCRPCHLQRLRERRLQQQKNLRISGQPQQQQHEQEQEEEEQMIALAALSRMRGQQQQQRQLTSADGNRFPASNDATEGSRCLYCGDDLLSGGDNNNRNCRSFVTTTVQRSGEQHEQQKRRFLLRPISSSAPVVSYRNARGGYGMGQTLLEAAQEDAAVDEHENEKAEHDAPLGVGASKFTLRAEGNHFASEDLVGSAEGTPLRNAFSVSKTFAVAVANGDQEMTKSFVGGPPLTLPGIALESQNLIATPLYNDISTTTTTTSNGTMAAPLCKASTTAAGDNSNNLNRNSAFLYASGDSCSIASSRSVLSADLAPAMTFREAFDTVKKQKPDVNPNIGFVLALRELAGGGDFSFSTSF